MSVKKRKLKDGTVVYDVTLEYGVVDGKREREKRTYRTLKEAKDADDAAARLRDSMKRRSGRLSLGDYIERYYWPIASRRLEATSLDTYRREIDKRILPTLGKMALGDLDRVAIQRMIDSAGTASVGRKSLGLLKSILNEAVGDGFITGNPACARYAMPEGGKKRDNGLILPDFERIGRFIADVRNDAPESITRLVVTGLALGLRPEERYALDYDDFDLENGTVLIKGAYVVASRRHGGTQLKDPKTENSRRLIPMSVPFIDYYITQDDGAGPWITNKDGGRLSPNTGRHVWSRYLRNHPDLPQVTLENMRHSFATACLHAGMNVEDLSRMLGHADINTTYRRYVRPDLSNIRDGLLKIPWSHEV